MIASPAPSGRKFDCPGCGGSLEVRAAGYTTTVACRYCGSVIDVASPEATLITQYHEAIGALAIPLGARGVLDGIEWEAIGWQARSGGGESWDEFLLFNPYAGYRWLVCYDGDWTFGRALETLPEMRSDEVVRWQGQSWEVEDDPADMVTTRVVGEFYWRVKVGEAVTGRTFWSGNRQLSCEQNRDEVTWTALDPIDGREVGRAFGVDPDGRVAGGGGGGGGSFGRKGMGQGGGGAQPLSGKPTSGDFASEIFVPKPFVRWTFVAAMMAAAIVFITLVALGGQGKPATGALAVVAEGPERTITVGPIEAKRTWQAVTIRADAQTFDNKWVELDYSLVDRATHQAIDSGDTVEHYSGTDSDGAWTEGSYSSSTVIARVPRGTYDLVITAAAHAWTSQPTVTTPVNPWALTSDGTIELTFSAGAGGVLWGNFMVVLLLLFAPPIFFAWRKMKAASE